MPCPMRFGPAAEDHDLLAVGVAHLVLVLVGRVVVRRVGLELRRARIDALEHRGDAAPQAVRSNLRLCSAEKVSELDVGEAVALCLAKQVVGNACKVAALEQLLHLGYLQEVVREPGIDAGELVDLVHAQALLQRAVYLEKAIVTGNLEQARQLGGGSLVEVAKAVPVYLQRADRLLHGLLEGAPDRHHLAHRLHPRAEHLVGAGNFSNAQRGILTTQ